MKKHRFDQNNLNRIKSNFLTQIAMENPGLPVNNIKRNHKRFLPLFITAILTISLVSLVFASAQGLDFGMIYNSFFQNTRDDVILVKDNKTTDAGIEISLLQAVTDGNRTHLLLQIEDLVGGRLDDYFVLEQKKNIIHGVERLPDFHLYSLTSPSRDMDNPNLFLLPASMQYTNPGTFKPGKKIDVSISRIISGEPEPEVKQLNVNLANKINNDTVRNWIGLQDWQTLYSKDNGILEETSISYTGELEDIRVLRPLDGQAPIVFPEAPWLRIDDIYMDDKVLYIQYWQDEQYDWHILNETFVLLAAGGAELEPVQSASVGEDIHFLIFDLDQVEELDKVSFALKGYYDLSVLEGNWDISFHMDVLTGKKELKATPENTELMDTVTVTVTPIGVDIQLERDIYGDEAYVIMLTEHFQQAAAPYLILTDGSVVELVFDGYMFDNSGGTVHYFNEYFNINMLESIYFMDEIYGFDSY